jgi:hypothetical protein
MQRTLALRVEKQGLFNRLFAVDPASSSSSSGAANSGVADAMSPEPITPMPRGAPTSMEHEGKGIALTMTSIVSPTDSTTSTTTVVAMTPLGHQGSGSNILDVNVTTNDSKGKCHGNGNGNDNGEGNALAELVRDKRMAYKRGADDDDDIDSGTDTDSEHGSTSSSVAIASLHTTGRDGAGGNNNSRMTTPLSRSRQVTIGGGTTTNIDTSSLASTPSTIVRLPTSVRNSYHQHELADIPMISTLACPLRARSASTGDMMAHISAVTPSSSHHTIDATTTAISASTLASATTATVHEAMIPSLSDMPTNHASITVFEVLPLHDRHTRDNTSSHINHSNSGGIPTLGRQRSGSMPSILRTSSSSCASPHLTSSYTTLGTNNSNIAPSGTIIDDNNGTNNVVHTLPLPNDNDDSDYIDSDTTNISDGPIWWLGKPVVSTPPTSHINHGAQRDADDRSPRAHISDGLTSVTTELHHDHPDYEHDTH